MNYAHETSFTRRMESQLTDDQKGFLLPIISYTFVVYWVILLLWDEICF